MTELVGIFNLGTQYAATSAYAIPNVTALRALTATTLRIPSSVQLASYYAAAGAAPDGGGGLLIYDSTDTTTADNGMTVFVDAANRRWKRSLSGTLTALQCGCHNGTTDSTTQMNAALQLGTTIRIPALTTITCSSGNLLTGNYASIVGESVGTSVLDLGGNFLQLSGYYVVLDNLTIHGSNANAMLYSTGVNLQFNKVTNCLLYNFSGPTVQISSQITSFLFADNIVQGSSYGFLYNIPSGNAGNDLIISGNYFNVSSDGIEINSPSSAGGNGLRDIVITGNTITSGNIGIGIASAHYFTITGNYIQSFSSYTTGTNTVTPQCIHIEDNQYGGVVSGNTMVCNSITAGSYPQYGMFVENNFGTSQAVTVVGNTFRSINNATATSCTATGGLLTVGGTIVGNFTVGMTIAGAGFPANTFISSLGTGTGGAGTYHITNFGGTISSPESIFGGSVGITIVDAFGGWVPCCNFSDNTFDTFAVGLQLDGNSVYGCNNNLFSNCYIGIACASAVQMRVVGTNRLHNVQVGANVSGGSTVGKLIWDDNSALIIALKSGTAVPGVIVEGFALTSIPLTISGSGAQTLAAFPLPSLMYGTLRSTVSNNGTANGSKRSETIKWDGTTLTVTALIDADVGALAGAATTESASKVNMNFTSTGALTGYTMNIDYSGEYYVA